MAAMTDDVHLNDAECLHGAGHARGLRTQADAGTPVAAGTSDGAVTVHPGGQPAGVTGEFRLPALVTAAGEQASVRFLEFFASTLRNPHTRRAYARAVEAFLLWCEDHAVPSIAAVQPLHVAAWIESQTRELSAPTVKQHLAAVRHLFD